VSIFTRLIGERQTKQNLDPLVKALQWAKRIYAVGAKLPPNVFPPTEETAGYIIPTFYKYGEKQIAIDLARWEASRQQPDGSFVAADGVPYTFDTAQVIRGFLSVIDDVPEISEPLRRASDYVATQIAADGRVLTVSYDTWRVADGGMFSEYCHLYVLGPLRESGRRLSEPRYVDAADRGVRYFKKLPDLVEFKPQLGTLSHIYGYMMEALVELDEIELAKKGLRSAQAIQKRSGAIPAYPGADWVCSTGMAQLAVAWYKLGMKEPADKSLQYLEAIQNVSGGFYGGYGKNAQYFPDKEIGWAAKYFLDCYLLKHGKNPLEGQN
jgi:malonyl-CoA O-methyltransferase